MTDDKLYTSLSANTIMAKVTNHFQRTKLVTSSTDKYYSLDSEDDFRSGCRNVSHQQQYCSSQNYPHPDDHTIRTTDTPGFKPFTVLYELGKKYKSYWLGKRSEKRLISALFFHDGNFILPQWFRALRKSVVLLAK